jgi:hypothetical protein
MDESTFHRYLTEYGDWGNEHMRAYGVPELWALHIQHCDRCRDVQARWDREAEERAEADAEFEGAIAVMFADFYQSQIEEEDL